jgi:hypothetical protein
MASFSYWANGRRAQIRYACAHLLIANARGGASFEKTLPNLASRQHLGFEETPPLELFTDNEEDASAKHIPI